jgi:hypothetical protein
VSEYLFRPLFAAQRWAAVAALLVAAGAHLPVIGHHLEEAPYMGVLFIVLTSACFGLAATLISFDSPAVYGSAAITCLLAIAGYAATRLVAFPLLADDVGNWTEPLGLVSVAAETVVVVGCLLVLRVAHPVPAPEPAG